MAKTNKQFIEDAKYIHGDLYSYELCHYVNSKTKVEIVCKEHGTFTIRPSNHLEGRGCIKCGVSKCSSQRKVPFKELLDRFRKCHYLLYEYVESSFSGMSSNIEVICKDHGKFLCLPTNHLKGQGCPVCARLSSRSSTEDFITKANILHNNKYEYSLVEYTISTSKVNIGCKDHGVFSQRPASHLAGNGCPKCPGSGFRRDKKGCLYILEDGDLVKVGITNREVPNRISEINAKGKDFKIVTTFIFQDGNDAFLLESKLLKYLRDNFSNPIEKFDGYTECFINVKVEEIISLARELQ